jgi:hypothetical protein
VWVGANYFSEQPLRPQWRESIRFARVNANSYHSTARSPSRGPGGGFRVCGCRKTHSFEQVPSSPSCCRVHGPESPEIRASRGVCPTRYLCADPASSAGITPSSSPASQGSEVLELPQGGRTLAYAQAAHLCAAGQRRLLLRGADRASRAPSRPYLPPPWSLSRSEGYPHPSRFRPYSRPEHPSVLQRVRDAPPVGPSPPACCSAPARG